MRLQVFSRERTRFKNIHSFVRENFDSPLPSLEVAGIYYVLTPRDPSVDAPDRVHAVTLDYGAGENLSVFCRVSFGSRGRRNHVGKLTGKEALLKFTEATGLEVYMDDAGRDMAAATFMGRVAEKKFDVMNAFEVTGFFTVVDPVRLRAALSAGVGARRSYGYGLIIANRAE